MPRTLLAILSALFLSMTEASQANEEPTADRTVIIIGVDGLSPKGLDEGDTPSLNRLIEQGSHTFHARAVLPTSSSPNWGSMISGASPMQHGITSNEWRVWNRTIEPAAEGASERFPTLFHELRTQRPESRIAVLYDWGGFGELFDHSNVDVAENTSDPESTIARAIEEYRYRRPDLLFVHLDHVDGAGHADGWHSETYFDAVRRADSLIGQLVKVVDEERGWASTTIIVTSDHGGAGRSHGGMSMDELEIPWIIAGAGIGGRREITGTVNTYDTACTAAALLRIRQNPAWIGKPIAASFATNQVRSGWTDSRYLPAPKISPASGLFTQEDVVVSMWCEVQDAIITYTTDGSEPTRSSLVYRDLFVVDEDATVRARAFMRGRQSRVSSSELRILTDETPRNVSYKYYEAPEGQAAWEKLPRFADLTPIGTGVCPEVSLATIETREDQFGIIFSTQLKIEEAGTYTFHLTSDDGSRLRVGRREIIDNDGSHGPIEVSGSIDLEPGLHPIIVEYFEDHGGESLELRLSGPSFTRSLIAHNRLALP